MSAEAIRIVRDGQAFSVKARPGASGVDDVDWLHHPVGYGFTCAGGPLSRAGMEEAIKDFLAGINPATGFLDRPGEDSSTRTPVERRTTCAKPLTVRKA